ncbi:MAG: sugar phosphate isomerase/epimerase [Bacteroidales bacterium]|nr:sugar phosphate isomerase/epimerase [Bacteroidales bacterium]MCU0407357.1 sugar phosphate isomerase/epimerase [Bacteroidales bacterium]
MNRRVFSRNALLASAGLTLMPTVVAESLAPAMERSLKKGIMWGSIGFGNTIMDKFLAAKAAGFDGVEVMSHLDRNEVIAARNATGLSIPSVCGAMHWKYLLSDPDPKVREEGVAALRLSMEDAAAYGADTVLLVPGRVSDIVSYDDCWTRSVDEIKKVLPLAIELKVKIAIENVWNNFLLSPMEAASYVDQFRSPFVGFYFDCGNILAFGWPEQWIKILNKRIAKIHIKEYSRKIADTQGKSAGFKVKLLEGDVSWQKVMQAVDGIGYNGYTTIEMPGGDTPEGLKDLCDRLVKIQSA